VFFIENMMRFICLILFCGFFAQPVWSVNVKIRAKVLPSCEFYAVASTAGLMAHSSAQRCARRNQATRIYFQAENKGAHLGQRMVMEF
jgi:hypothetical protein